MSNSHPRGGDPSLSRTPAPQMVVRSAPRADQMAGASTIGRTRIATISSQHATSGADPSREAASRRPASSGASLFAHRPGWSLGKPQLQRQGEGVASAPSATVRVRSMPLAGSGTPGRAGSRAGPMSGSRPARLDVLARPTRGPTTKRGRTPTLPAAERDDRELSTTGGKTASEYSGRSAFVAKGSLRLIVPG